MAVDGSSMDVADETANAGYFGYPAASRGQSAFPQARLLGLVECGTHAVVAALYHERGEIEGVFDELKTHLRSNSTVLRSKTPDLVKQEMWGLLLAHFAIRQIMTQAAWPRQLDPDKISFTHAVRVIKRKMPQAAAIPP